MKKPLLIQGKVMHSRSFPKKNSFNYDSVYISTPISKIKKLKRFLFSLGGFNLFGFYKSDYGAGHSDNMRGWIENILKENDVNGIKEIVLVTHPRVFGYVFNPVSFWLCFDGSKNLIAVLSEVRNTCGQKHSYLCFKDGLGPINSNDWIESKKEFYVSPFMKTEGEYRFRFEIGSGRMNFFINYMVDGKLKLSTSLKCSLQEFSNKNLFFNFLRVPFFTIKTVFLIHYQAVKLYLKLGKYYNCPSVLKRNLTVSKNGK